MHLDGDHQFGPRTIGEALPFGTKSEDVELEEADTEEETTATEDDSGPGKAVGAVIALAFLVALGVAVKKYRGGDEEELETEEQPDVIVN